MRAIRHKGLTVDECATLNRSAKFHLASCDSRPGFKLQFLKAKMQIIDRKFVRVSGVRRHLH